MRRRTLLKRLGAVTAAGTIAGCLDDATTDETDPGAGDDQTDGDDGDDGDDQTDGDDQANGDDGDDDSDGKGDEDVEATVTDSDVETIDAGCGEGDDAAAEFGTESAIIEGAIEAPNPCHTATVEGASIETGTLTVEVGLAETDDEACTECVGLVEYEASIAIDGIGGLDEIVVYHVADGDRAEIERTSR